MRDTRHAPEQGLSELLLNTFAIIKVAVLSPLCWLLCPSALPRGGPPQNLGTVTSKGPVMFPGGLHPWIAQSATITEVPCGKAWGLTQSYSPRCQS